MEMNKSKLKECLKSPIYIAEEEIPVFCHYASLAKNTLVDIGAGWGTSAFLMLINAPSNAHIFSIDPFTGDTIKPWKKATEKICKENVKRALIAVGKIDAFQRWELVFESSHQAAIYWLYKSIDLIYLDGDHRYIAVKQDFDDWFKYIKPGGVLLLHDSRRVPCVPENIFSRGWPGPTKLAKDLIERNDLDLIDKVFSLTIWRKK